MANILVIRLSALGDVAISVPLLKNLAEQYPEHQFTMISQPFAAKLFEDCPSNVTFKAVETKGKHIRHNRSDPAFSGNRRKKIMDAVCDMHDTLRSHFLSLLFELYRIPVFRIKQGAQRASKADSSKE